MEPTMREMLKQAIGITDEDLAKLSPNIEKTLAASPRFQQYKIVAEVVDAKYCSAGIKPGQKYIFGSAPPVINMQESTCPTCLRALGPLTSPINTIMDRIAEGSDPNQAIFPIAECLDPGLEHGGLGKVRFKVYAEKV